MWGIALLCFVAITTVSAHGNDDSFRSFLNYHGKVYSDRREWAYRKLVYEDNLDYIRKHNELASNGNVSFTLGVNKFADMTSAEFTKIMNGYMQRSQAFESRSNQRLYQRKIVTLPDSVDWREHGYVTPVKDQGQCGSCWAFSAVGSLEGQHYNATKTLVSLSEQNLVDCSFAYGNNGCKGGIMDNAFRYVMDNRGIDTEQSYPYTARVGQCMFERATVGSNCVGFHDIPHGDEESLQAASAEVGPISVAIDASQRSFQLYHSGVYIEPECSTTKLDHGVLVVGYGTEASQDFWIVKNSWGAGWGEAGYIKMGRNRSNQCGIATLASFPTVTA